MTQPELNMRSVKRIDDGFTIKGAKVLSDQRQLCDFCGVTESCKIKQSLQRLKRKHQIDADLRSCLIYQPILTFKSEKGLGNFFNTFRLRSAWARRVKKGDLVSLWNVSNNTRIGSAEVMKVYSGTLHDMLEDHAHFNHMMLDRQRELAPEALFKIMQNSYGKNWTQRDGEASVIFMRRRDEQSHLQDQAGDSTA